MSCFPYPAAGDGTEVDQRAQTSRSTRSSYRFYLWTPPTFWFGSILGNRRCPWNHNKTSRPAGRMMCPKQRFSAFCCETCSRSLGKTCGKLKERGQNNRTLDSLSILGLQLHRPSGRNQDHYRHTSRGIPVMTRAAPTEPQANAAARVFDARSAVVIACE